MADYLYLLLPYVSQTHIHIGNCLGDTPVDNGWYRQGVSRPNILKIGNKYVAVKVFQIQNQISTQTETKMTMFDILYNYLRKNSGSSGELMLVLCRRDDDENMIYLTEEKNVAYSLNYHCTSMRDIDDGEKIYDIDENIVYYYGNLI